ncbi:PREDICTED: uncharacterized protein LOC109221751 [Nicotiana attenuata]|uniref:DUF1664 domain-containing protein n=1 Tax=Nicotiana attenuata TaxID=49451 RepID=A0A1J6K240_NICAT|nr:PREDICTED: uncharacterized protein LOC109214690 [Nicotiana attenuata]XP_019236107.1 PREDICTED: uncharacterized protein LOC109216412 [Nicotiana attenuata]XP_019241747.1 PREDICTED: uncharacterized protein LOC109221751 [Nicotiana attenuata]OIT19200.1 hypothetical protein A4A49_28595 [Nicotiana attenuata]
MAMQAGVGLTKIVFIVGAGYTGTLLFKNGKLSDVIGELQNLVKSYEKSGESDGGESDVIAAQVRRLAMEVRQLASARPITVLNGSSSGDWTSLIVPAAAVGALGYGYMWWKGLSFSDLMYVTKKNMATAVSNLTKHLEHVSDALAATKKHLTQRIENVDGKLDEQMEMSKLLRNEVNGVRGDLSKIDCDLDELKGLVYGLDGKLLSLEGKQDLTNAGVMYLCDFISGKRVKMPETLQEQLKTVGNSIPSLMGLKELADSSPQAMNSIFITEIAQDGTDKLLEPPRPLLRTASIRC